MFCDINRTKYGKKLVSQIGKRNAKQFGMALDTQRWKRWFGKGKTTRLENGYHAPYINPLMQVINEQGQTYNLLQRFRWSNVKEAESFLSTVEGITKDGGKYRIEDGVNKFINVRLVAEVEKLYPGLLSNTPEGIEVNSDFNFTRGRLFATEASSTPELSKNLEFGEAVTMVSNFLDNVGVNINLVDQFTDANGNPIRVLAAANFLNKTVDVISDVEKRPRAWNKLPEEAAHWWYRLLKQDAPLKKALWDAAKNSLIYKELVQTNYGNYNDIDSLTEEAVGKLIAEAIYKIEQQTASEGERTFWRKFIDWIKNLLKGLNVMERGAFNQAAERILNSDLSELMDMDEYMHLVHGIEVLDNPAATAELVKEKTGVDIVPQEPDYAEYLLSGRYRLRSKLMPKTIAKIQEKIVNTSNALTKTFDEYQKKNLGLKDIRLTIFSKDEILRKFKNGIALNSPIKLDTAKKEELELINNVREKIKTENPNLKSVRPEDFIKEVETMLNLMYAMKAKKLDAFTSYRISDTFVDQAKEPTHLKMGVYVNDEYFTGGHFGLEPFAWYNITPYNFQNEFANELTRDDYTDLVYQGGASIGHIKWTENHEGKQGYFFVDNNGQIHGTGQISESLAFAETQEIFGRRLTDTPGFNSVLLHEFQTDFLDKLDTYQKDANSPGATKKMLVADHIIGKDVYMATFKDRIMQGTPYESKFYGEFEHRLEELANMYTEERMNKLQADKEVAFENLRQYQSDIRRLLDYFQKNREVFENFANDWFTIYHGNPAMSKADKQSFRSQFANDVIAAIEKEYGKGTGLTHGNLFQYIIGAVKGKFNKKHFLTSFTNRKINKGHNDTMGFIQKMIKGSVLAAHAAKSNFKRFEKMSKITEEQFKAMYENLVQSQANLEGLFQDGLNETANKIEFYKNFTTKYLNPLFHHALITIKNSKSQPRDIRFSGGAATLLTQGNAATAELYAGPEEVEKDENRKLQWLRTAAARKYDIIAASVGVAPGQQMDSYVAKQSGVPQLNAIIAADTWKDARKAFQEYRKVVGVLAAGAHSYNTGTPRIDNLNGSVYSMYLQQSGGTFMEVGVIYAAFSKVKGIKLYYENTPGLKNNTPSYKVDTTEYKATAPMLYALDTQAENTEQAKLVEEAKALSANVKGMYSIFFRDRAELALFEAATQANSSASEKQGAINAFGERIVEIAQKLYPNAKVGDTFEPVLKQKSNGEQSEFSNKIVTILDKLSLRFGIPYRLVNDPQADWKGYYSADGVIVINEAKVTEDTPFHEFLHPFILVLEKQNPALYNALVQELKTTREGLATIAYVRNKYPELTEKDKLHEAVVQYLGKLAAAKYNKQSSPFNRFWTWVKNLFRKLDVDIASLSPNTKLSEIADLMVDDLFISDLRQAARDANTLDRYSKNDTELSYESVFERVKDQIMILEAIIKRRNKGDQFKQSIAELSDIFEHADAVVSINNFVANALQYVDMARKRFEELREGVKDPSKVDPKDVSHNIFVLNEIQQLLNVYQSLDDIQTLYIEEGKLSSDDTMAKLAAAIHSKKRMIQDFKQFALTYTTEWLFPYLEPTNKQLIKEGRAELVVTKEIFRDRLKMAMNDISAFGYWLGTTINSQDPVSAAVGLALKDTVYENQQKDLNTKIELMDTYEAVRGNVTFASQASEENFNKLFMREIDSWEQDGVDENDEPKFKEVRRLAIHTEYLTDQWEKSRRELYARLGKRPEKEADPKGYRDWKDAESKWYRENTRVNPDAANIITQRQATMSKRQFEKWKLENSKEIEEEVYEGGWLKSKYYAGRILSYNKEKNTFRIYDGELVVPTEKWKNKEWERLMASNPYFARLYKAYDEANKKLGVFRLKHGLIPQVPKNKALVDSAKEGKNWKERLKKMRGNIAERFSVNAEEEESKTIQRLDGRIVKKVNVMFTTKLDRDNLDTNLLETVLKFSQMANHYDSMNELEPNILLLKTVLNGDTTLGIKGREVAKTNSKGVQKLNAITNKLVPKEQRAQMVNHRLNEFIDDVVYGDEEILETFNIFGREVSLNKVADNLGFLTALQTMALNFNGGISNVAIGNFNNSIEAVGGRFYGKRDWIWAQKEYWANVPKSLGSLAGVAESELDKLADHYDVPQGEFQDQFGKHLTGGKAKQAFKTSTLFFIQRGGEHQIQITGLLSLMHATKVKTKDGRDINLYQAWKEYKTLEGLIANTDWTQDSETAFRNRLHAITKNLQGVYNKFDKSMLQRRWLGRLAIMFRKYMFMAFKSRYGAEYVDYELGTTQQGYWNAAMKKLYKEFKQYKAWAIVNMWKKDGYSETERAAVNKTLYEFGVMLVALVLGGMVGLMDDDDDSWLSKFTALQITRFGADIKQYIWFPDFIRIVRNPAATVTMLEKWFDFLGQLVTGPFDEYERATGMAEKGDSKLKIKFYKMTPVIRQIVNLMTPEEQMKFYQLTGSGAK